MRKTGKKLTERPMTTSQNTTRNKKTKRVNITTPLMTTLNIKKYRENTTFNISERMRQRAVG